MIFFLLGRDLLKVAVKYLDFLKKKTKQKISGLGYFFEKKTKRKIEK
jgi:hypothetical protein